jgi:hypothetical protein
MRDRIIDRREELKALARFVEAVPAGGQAQLIAKEVTDANEVAGVPFARIVTTTELVGKHSGPSTEGGSA